MRTRTEAKETATPEQTLLVLLAQTGDRTALEQLLRDSYAPFSHLKESAAILEIPIGTAKSRLHYGVTALRKHLIAERNQHEP